MLHNGCIAKRLLDRSREAAQANDIDADIRQGIGGDQGYTPKTPRPLGWIEWGEARV